MVVALLLLIGLMYVTLALRLRMLANVLQDGAAHCLLSLLPLSLLCVCVRVRILREHRLLGKCDERKSAAGRDWYTTVPYMRSPWNMTYIPEMDLCSP